MTGSISSINRILIFSGITFLLIGTISTPATSTNSEYVIDIEGGVDVPPRTITLKGEQLEAASISRRFPGDQIDIGISAPEESTYELVILNSERQIAYRTQQSGSSRVTVVAAFNPGTYGIGIVTNGTFRDIQPLVIASHRVSITVPNQAKQGTVIEVSVGVTRVYDRPNVHQVEVVVANESDVIRFPVENPIENRNSVKIPIESIEAGTYRVQAIVQGEPVVDGRHEVVGVSDGRTLRVIEANSTPSPDRGQTGAPDRDKTESQQPTESPTLNNQDNSEVITPLTARPVETASTNGSDHAFNLLLIGGIGIGILGGIGLGLLFRSEIMR